MADDSKPARQLATEDDPPQDIFGLLGSAVALVDTTSPLIARRLGVLRERLSEGRLQLAVLGQFKRGKSTLLNALLGAAVLPAGIIPLTAVPTFISWRPKPLVRVTYRSARSPEVFDVAGSDAIRDILFRFVAEEANPKNHLNVERVDLFYPAPLLQEGVVLIDTPGIGSTHQHNTDAALEVLPECDAALFVTSADPPITEAELTYLNVVKTKAARVYFVLNKADYLERADLEIAVAFLRRTLQTDVAGDEGAAIFCTSALAGLKAKQNCDEVGLESSGIAKLESHLLQNLVREKLALLKSAIRQRAVEQLAEAEADVKFKSRTLEMPIEDLEKRGAILDEALARIAVERSSTHDLLAGDRRRIAEQLEDHAQRLREKSRHYLSDVLTRTLARSDHRDIEAAVRDAIGAVVPKFFDEELSAGIRHFGQVTEEILATRARRVDDLVNLVRRTAAELFDVPFVATSNFDRFNLRQEPYWVTQPWNEKLISLPSGVVSRLLPKAIRQARECRQFEDQLSELVLRNVENLRWATLQGLIETFRKFGVVLDDRLASVLEATQGAVKAASISRSSRSEDASTELATLRRTLAGLGEVRSAIAGDVLSGSAEGGGTLGPRLDVSDIDSPWVGI